MGESLQPREIDAVVKYLFARAIGHGDSDLRGLRRFLGQGYAPVRAHEKMTPRRLAQAPRRCSEHAAVLAWSLGRAAAADAPNGRRSRRRFAASSSASRRSMSVAGFGELACGSNGGPPRQQLDDWTGVRQMPARGQRPARGLRPLRRRGRLYRPGDRRSALRPRQDGTRAWPATPVILSALFDRDGVVRACASSPIRAPPPTSGAWRTCSGSRSSPATVVMAGLAWTPHRPRARPPSAAIFVKQRCEKRTPERDLFLEARFLRKPGQADLDPRTGEYKAGQFESWTRLEIFEPGLR